jgi:hypothetical protein
MLELNSLKGAASAEWRLNQTERYLVNAARCRAKKRGLEFTITHRDIEIPSTCPLLGIPIELGVGTGHSNRASPSLDRIDNSLGYTKDNVWVISRLANTMKNSASIEELLAFSKNVLQYFG